MHAQLLGYRIDSRSRRRALVILLYASYAALIACFALASRSGVGLLFLAGLLPSGFLLMSAFWTLSQVALPYTDQGAGVTLPPMDERQIQVRDRAFYRAYQGISSVAGLWIVYETIARTAVRQWFWVPDTFDEYQAVVWGYLLVAMTLPGAIIAWTEPDLRDADGETMEFKIAR